jgi:hypothetical protein
MQPDHNQADKELGSWLIPIIAELCLLSRGQISSQILRRLSDPTPYQLRFHPRPMLLSEQQGQGS